MKQGGGGGGEEEPRIEEMGHEKWILASHMIWPGSLPGTGLKASKIPFLGLQEAGLSDESKSKGGYLRHFVLVLKQAVPGSRAVWLQSAIRSGAAASPLLPLRVAGSRLCYFSTEDSASWDPPRKLSRDSVAIYTGEFCMFDSVSLASCAGDWNLGS